MYRSKARDLAEDALGLAEALDAVREGVTEKMEDVTNAKQQVKLQWYNGILMGWGNSANMKFGVEAVVCNEFRQNAVV